MPEFKRLKKAQGDFAQQILEGDAHEAMICPSCRRRSVIFNKKEQKFYCIYQPKGCAGPNLGEGERKRAISFWRRRMNQQGGATG